MRIFADQILKFFKISKLKEKNLSHGWTQINTDKTADFD